MNAHLYGRKLLSVITLFWLISPIILFSVNTVQGQSISAVASSSGCKDGGIITPVVKGISVPQYQLLDADGRTVLKPVFSGTDYAMVSSFVGLINGTYRIRVREGNSGVRLISDPIVVSDNYQNMSVSVSQTRTVFCTGGNVDIAVQVTGGKANFTYKLLNPPAGYTEPDTQVSSSSRVIFKNLIAGSQTNGQVYNVLITDNCGQSLLGTVSIVSTGLGVSDVKSWYGTWINRANPTDCNSALRVSIVGGLRNVNTNVSLNSTELSKFKWYYTLNGVKYGKDANGDGFADVNGDPQTASNSSLPPPNLPIADLLNYNTANSQVYLVDECGSSLVFDNLRISNTAGRQVRADFCNEKPFLSMGYENYSVVALPFTFTFTDKTDPSKQPIVVKQTAINQKLEGDFIGGHQYSYSATDCNGLAYATNINISMPIAATPITYRLSRFSTAIGYGTLEINAGSQITGNVTADILSAPAAAQQYVGTTLTQNTGNNGTYFINLNGPVNGLWPKGNYVLRINANSCVTTDVSVNINGYSASFNGYVTEAVCGGFNLTMKAAMDDYSLYETYIVSGPSNVGATRNFKADGVSLSYDNLSYGTYVIGIKMKGSAYANTNSTQTIVYTPQDIIQINKEQTGGYVCTATDRGTLMISASTLAPAPNNTLQYALYDQSTSKWGDYQSSNLFSNLLPGSYTYRVMDGCMNVMTSEAQVSTGGAPNIVLNGNFVVSSTTVCQEVNLQLSVDIIGSGITYLWSGQGITNDNKNLRNPFISKTKLTPGVTYTYTVTVTLSGCVKSTSLNVKIDPQPYDVVVTNPQPVCFPGKIDLTKPAVTAGSSNGLTYSYFSDEAGQQPLANPEAIALSGTYYIKGQNAGGCFEIKPVVVTINPTPVIVITNPTAVCYPNTVDITAVAVTGGTATGFTLKYYTDNAGTTALADPTKVATSGTYYIQPISATGCTGEIKPVVVTINEKPAIPLITAGSNTTFCAGDNVVLNAPDAPAYRWYRNGSQVATTKTYTATTSGAYTLVIGNSSGCFSNPSAAVTVTVNSLPSVRTITPKGPTSFCPGGSVILSASAATAGWPYRWYKDGTLISGAIAVNYTAQDAGSYTVTLVNPGTGCESPQSAAIQVSFLPDVALALVSDASSVNQQVNINTPISDIVYQITNGLNGTVTGLPDGLSANLSNGRFTISGSATNAGTFSYVLSAIGACGTITQSGTIIVNSDAVINPVVVPGSDAQTICSGTAIAPITYTFQNTTDATVTGLPDGLSASYQSGSLIISGTTNTAGKYTYTLTATGPGRPAMLNGTITINALPVINITTSTGNIRLSKGETLMLEADGGDQYAWEGANLLTPANQKQISIRPKTSGIYKVTVTNANGCTTTNQIEITVEEDYKLIPTNVITPNGDGKNDTWVVENIDYYPENKVYLFDRAGRKIYEKQGYNSDWNGTYNGTPLAEGIYFYVIDMGNGIGLKRGTVTIIRGARN